MALHGECPEWVPNYNTLAGTVGPSHYPVVLLTPPYIGKHRTFGVGGTDIWGVRYIPTEDTGGATLPEPNNFILDDVRKWRDIIKAPDVTGFDWEKMAADHIKAANIDREQTAVSFDVHFGYFQHLMAFMGFSEGLCAMYEEPEEVKALLHYICDFYCMVTERMIDYYKPEVLSLKDDSASWTTPFVSPEIYEDILLPLYTRHAKFANDRGIPISFHNCGKCESQLDALVSIGVRLWDPAQTCNDLAGIKAKYGNKLVIAGGWDARGRLVEDDVTDEELYDSVRQVFDLLAPGGGYVFAGGFLGRRGDPVAKHRNEVIHKAAAEIGRSFYK